MSNAFGLSVAEWAAFQDMAVIKPYRSIGNFVAQVTISEDHIDALEITQHPIEQGAVITDHAYKRPALVTIRCGWSNSPNASAGNFLTAAANSVASIVSTSSAAGSQPDQARQIYQGLLQMQSDRIPFDIYTGKRMYTNMLLETLSVDTRIESENALRATLRCRQLIIVSTSVVTLPNINAQAQKNPQKTTPTKRLGSLQLLPGSGANTTSLTSILG